MDYNYLSRCGFTRNFNRSSGSIPALSFDRSSNLMFLSYPAANSSFGQQRFAFDPYAYIFFASQNLTKYPDIPHLNYFFLQSFYESDINLEIIDVFIYFKIDIQVIRQAISLNKSIHRKLKLFPRKLLIRKDLLD